MDTTDPDADWRPNWPRIALYILGSVVGVWVFAIAFGVVVGVIVGLTTR